MPPTATKDQPADRSTRAMPTTADQAPAPAGDGGAGGKASFALFASFVAVLLSLAALLAVAFKLDDN